MKFLMPGRDIVIENIKQKASEGLLNDKVEPGDASMTLEESRQMIKEFLEEKKTLSYKVKNIIARRWADILTMMYNQRTTIEGAEKIKKYRHSAAIISSNHFSPADNTVLRKLLSRFQKGQLVVVSQTTNFVGKGWIGFLLRYIDALPLCRDVASLGTYFEPMITETMNKKKWLLMYPEQEMWFNYRKPRPERRGVFHYASKFNVPVISCFVEIQDYKPEKTVDKDGFCDTTCTLHVLDPIWPDPTKSVKQNSLDMAAIDYKQKVECYERVYGKKLDYTFENWDIAGWHPELAKKD